MNLKIRLADFSNRIGWKLDLESTGKRFSLIKLNH